jgi:hypothetical protein
MSLPRARTKDLIVEHSANEILIFDTQRERAYALKPLTAAVWERCDGKTSVEDLAGAVTSLIDGATRDVVELALTELADLALVSGWEGSRAAARVSRRALLTRVAALVGVTTILAPGIAMGR